MLRQLAGIPGFGLLYSVTLLLVAVPAAIIYTLAWGVWPWTHSAGFEVRVSGSVTRPVDSPESAVIVGVWRAKKCTLARCEPEMRLNSRPILRRGLRNALRAELSRRATHIVYIEGDPATEVADIVRAIDIANEAWYGVRVVLLIPRKPAHKAGALARGSFLRQLH